MTSDAQVSLVQREGMCRRLQRPSFQPNMANLCMYPCAEVLTSHASNNVPENIFAKIGANLHLRRDHPICMIKDTIYSYFDKLSPGLYEKFDELKPVVVHQSSMPPDCLQHAYPSAHPAWPDQSRL